MTSDINQDDGRKGETSADASRTTIAVSSTEIVGRYGSASAEFIKGYRGVDNQTGTILSKGLEGISREGTSIEKRAGWAAEVHTTSLENAEHIINKSNTRTVRSDDLLRLHGKDAGNRYREVVDVLQVDGSGNVIEGTEAQMKFEANGNVVARRVTSETDKYSKYFGKKLSLPSDQVEGARDFCRKRAGQMRARAANVEAEGNSELAASLRERADKFEKLANEDIVDAGISKDDAVDLVRSPKIKTLREIAKVSHRAGVEGAKVGAVVGGSISIFRNVLQVAQDGKEFDSGMAMNVVTDTFKAACVGYGVSASASALKAFMEQSHYGWARSLAGTSAPALAVNACLSLASSIRRYVSGEIDAVRFLEEAGEKAVGMLSSGLVAAVGAFIIPGPLVGAAIGGMMGYALSSMFYQATLEAGRERDLALDRLEHVRAIEVAARATMANESAQLATFVAREVPELHRETEEFFGMVEEGVGSSDAFAQTVNRYASLMGAQLEFRSFSEFEGFMSTSEPLRL